LTKAQDRKKNDDEPVEAARCAGLRYVDDKGSGIRRRRTGRGFQYLRPRGRRVRDGETLSRTRSLAIPPAWTQVLYPAYRDRSLLEAFKQRAEHELRRSISRLSSEEKAELTLLEERPRHELIHAK
jgi:DNA topoisomerase IB